ncbi:S-methyl-5-thioribose-1-phosphate isomerase, partial [Candidatus Saccharibacteria bacterium]|nr:S-methyl-5-thioribose-1-phosphate isomerase [Candidatus Saccharibacteria bacterium]NIW79290.1 S-methyl-5-thioribose-1-phosphate isomerase [Calditrichia bacterium]
MGWALKNIKDQLQKTADISVEDLKLQLLEIAKEIQEDDGQRCEDIGKHGLAVVPSGATILTHCNTGALATGGIGTAFGVIFNAHRNGNNVAVFATETRPVLQGARLTVWELMTAHIPVHLICDSAAASLVQQKKVDMVILGADRIAADGSVANKIGTYNLA